MSHQQLVSVIIIFLNAADFLQEAIDSVFAQTYDAWELLLVDDGSTDGSSAIALSCAEQHPGRVRYLQHDGHQNLGMSASRNLGIRHASGTYLTFLDADDVWLPANLQEQVKLLASQPTAAMVYGPIQWWYSWAADANDRDFVQDLGVRLDRLILPPALLLRFLRRDAAAPSGMLLRRAAVEAVGGYEQHFRGMYEDQAFCAKVCLRAPAFVTSGCWYRYRQHPNSSSNLADTAGQYEYGRLAFLNWFAAYLSAEELRGTRVWRAIQIELWLYHHPAVYRALRQFKRRVRRLKRRTQSWRVRVFASLKKETTYGR